MSNYMDFWFIDKRNRKKNLLMYLIIFVAFYLFTNLMIYLFVHGSYKPMQNYNIEKSNIEVIVEDARTTNVNGYVKGKVNNNTGGFVRDKYLKFEFVSERNINVGNKYIDLTGLAEDESKEFEIKYKFENVNNFKVSTIEKEEMKDINESEIIKIK